MFIVENSILSEIRRDLNIFDGRLFVRQNFSVSTILTEIKNFSVSTNLT